MNTNLAKNVTALEHLSSILLSTLDETIFFSELSKYIKNSIGCDKIKVYKVQEDTSAKLISLDGGPVHEGQELMIGEGPAGHVIRTKRSYFSNNTARDPLFAKELHEGIKAELCFPVGHEGVLIATIHLQNLSVEREFSREHINSIQDIVNEIKRPLANMKLYLSAEYLNEMLLKKIEEKERELEERKNGMRISDSFRVLEKEMIGKSEVMQNLLKMVDKAALSESSVLITGEAGTGKEMIAKRIHCRGRRKAGPFVVFDCSSYNEQEIEAELFGVTSSDSFSGRNDKLGVLELANGGTLLIKKISKLSATVQAKMINFMNEGIAIRVGEKIPYRSDVRLIVSSSDDINKLIEQGLFRNDLFYSIARINLQVPAVRDRKDDVELFAYHFLNKDKKNEEMKSLSPCVISALKEYKWPGNLRELQNIIERAYILAEGMIVDKNHLSDHICKKEEVKEEKVDKFLNFKEVTLEELEKAHICHSLEFLGGNKTKTAKLLGITVKTLYNKLHSYGMIGDEKELSF